MARERISRSIEAGFAILRYAKPRGKHARIMVRNPAIVLVGVEKVDDKVERKASVVHFAEWLVGGVHGQDSSVSSR